MKIAVFFPGIGYHCDKPLLYFSAKIAAQYQYETVRVSYTGLGRAIPEAFEGAFSQTEKCLETIDWDAYEDILFVSKSIGTAVAAAYAEKHRIRCGNVYYTPLEQTFASAPQHGIVFHGTNDPWAETCAIRRRCEERGLLLHVTENAGHSLEVGDDALKDLEILNEVMALTRDYIAGRISTPSFP